MAARKSKNLLPNVFRTSANEKFLNATVDQLVSEPKLKDLYGYIGRTFAPTFKKGDSYVTEDSARRQNYQLEPSTIVTNDDGDSVFFSSYLDFLDKIKYYGGYSDKHSRLFNSEYYSFDPKISLDAFVNFGQYYWLPNGPSTVQVNTTGVELEKNYVVSKNDNTNQYDYLDAGVKNNTIVLARGGTYTFEVDQSSEFWIQRELGIDGRLNATPTISSRDILGVTNNGATSGTVTFNVPQSTAQDRFLKMPKVAEVDYAVPFAYAQAQNRFLSDFLNDFPEYVGIAGALDGKTVIFVDQDQLTNFQEDEVWLVAGETDSISITYDKGTLVPQDVRYNVWNIQLIPVGDEQLINIYPGLEVAQEEKVYVKYGLGNANKEYYKEYDGFFHQTPLITAPRDTLYIQDGSRGDIYTTIKIVDYNNFQIDVENDILGKEEYTSPNGIVFTNGLKIQFDTDVTPASYQEKTYYVADVGTGIRLVDEDIMVTPESYNDEIATNYPLKQLVLDKATTTAISAGEIITVGSSTIEVYTEIASGSIKITTFDSINDINRGETVSGTGIASGTTVYDVFADTVFPEYITIKRSAKDCNAWSRNNRWFHVDVIKATSAYNDEPLILDQELRAKRPIIQFDEDLLLFNYGRIGKNHIDILDTTFTDAFNEFEGKVLDTAFGETLFDGMRVVFASDTDPLVRNKVYQINLVQFEVDPVTELPTGDTHIKLVKADDGDVEQYDSLVVRKGINKGKQYWFNGSEWAESQQKTLLQQAPLFDVLDENGVSLSNTQYYPRTTFAGTKLFGYTENTSGTDDSVLGFPLSYRSFQSQGDIRFTNYFNTDKFDYVTGQTVLTKNINTLGFLQSIVDRTTLTQKNTWLRVIEHSKQYQTFDFNYSGTNTFKLDITPHAQDIHGTSNTIPYINVFKNNEYLSQDKWSIDLNNIVTITDTLVDGDNIDIEVYSNQNSKQGHYKIPTNLDLNAQNVNVDSLTLGQIRNHVVSLSRNSTNVEGNILGACNLRDINIKSQGGSILQHSGSIPYGQLFLVDEEANFVDAMRFAQREYTKFKNKFLELSVSLDDIDPTDPISSVDLILTQLNINKTSSQPFFYSDMVPYGSVKNTITYTVFDPLVTNYEITNVFSSTTLSNQAILVYLNDEQLIIGWDYDFESDRPVVTINSENITLAVDDVITIIEYANTDGSYIPETPTKLGTYPKFIPEIYEDDTYQTPINAIRGHDGSITPAFNDYRDDFLLELEKRIYNNIKVGEPSTCRDILTVRPGKFRSNGYTYKELWNIISKGFLNWVGTHKINFSENSTFQSNAPFTWNYNKFVDRLDGEYLPGSWRSIYQYFYDTIYPHTRPWEMLGYSRKPEWWENEYGPGPYTGGNTLLWEDLEAGRIKGGPRATVDQGYGVGIDPIYIRPRLTEVIPVDANGYLLSPEKIIAKAVSPKSAASSWAAGEMGPAEWAWRTSSEFPYAMNLAMALAKPANYFAQYIDTYRLQYNTQLRQLLNQNKQHIQQNDILFNGDRDVNNNVIRSAGYLNWIAEYLRMLGINPSTKINNLLDNYEVRLAYKMGGFSDKKYLKVLAEQSSPTSTNDSVLIPDENYNVDLLKSTPISRLTYSAVIVEKTSNGFSVRGYDLSSPYFTIIPSVVNNRASKITVLNQTGTIYRDFQKSKITVPYGYEFKSKQQVVDFLVSYQRYLVAQGFTFNDRDGDLGETRNWLLSVREFLHWIQQGWKQGSIIVLSPITNSLKVTTKGNIVDEVTDSQFGSKVVDQNFNLIKRTGYKSFRTAEGFRITLLSDSMLAFAELNLVQYEHVLIFDNSTVFNDVIYRPELGNRQYRLKLIGQKTAEWDGSLHAPGFIYNSDVIDQWNSGKDYLKGDLVEYKDLRYVALKNTPASINFEFNNWKQLQPGEINSGLLKNFSTIAVGSQSFYDSYGKLKDNNQLEYSHGLIGFKPRQYLDDLGLSLTSQIEFYKGYIKQKGTKNAVDALTNASFNNQLSQLSFFEEWAVRTGEYGSLDNNPYLEIPLDEKSISVNPATIRFVNDSENNLANGKTIFNKSQLYRSTTGFTGKIALNRDEHSDYDNDILTAGYVNIDDVDATVYDITTNYNSLNEKIDDIGTGYTIWTARDFNGNWNVYRISETDNHAIKLSNALDGFITWTFDKQHQLGENDIFLVKGFDNRFDGFYQVSKVLDLNRVNVRYQGNIANLASVNDQTGKGMFFGLDSMRFYYMEDARVFGLEKPLHRWRAGDTIWIDVDAATTTANGQSYSVPKDTWKVYEKTMPWDYDHTLLKSSGDYTSNDEFGKSVKLSYDGLLAVVGSPRANTAPYYGIGVEEETGQVNTFDKGFTGSFVTGATLQSDVGNVSVTVREYGHCVDQAIGKVAVGAPGSYGNIGFAFVYNRPQGTTSFLRAQPLWSGNVNATGDRFGSSISLDEHGRWAFVGAPGNDKVYVFGLNNNITPESEVLSINDRVTLELSGTVSANVGDIITQPNTSSTTVVADTSSGANVIIGSLQNITTTGGNIFINAVDSGLTVVGSTSESNINIITTSFTPEINGVAESLHVSNSKRVFIPDLDYTVSGNTITFSDNLEQEVYVIAQQPYYTLVETIQGPTGSNFGASLDSSLDGAQLGIGAPNDTVNVAVFSDGTTSVTKSIEVGVDTANVSVNGNVLPRTSYTEYDGAGSVYVYDRVIEAFKTTGLLDYTTTGNINTVHRVTINNEEVHDYFLPSGVGSNTIRFINPPQSGQIVEIETNKFNLLEKLIGVDSLDGSLTAIQEGTAFGTDLTICSNNCAIYVGAPYYDNGTQYSSGAVWKFHNRGRLYGTNTAYAINPTFSIGDSIRLDNFEVTATGTDLDSLVDDINDANILGVTATNENGVLRLDSDRTVAKNLLRIRSGNTVSGSEGIIADADMKIFAYMQIIVNPYGAPGEYFGNKVVLAQNAYMLVISSERGSTRSYATFDENTTTLDDNSTAFFDTITGSGSVYIYELYDDPRDEVEHPGRYAFAQQLNLPDIDGNVSTINDRLNSGDRFGAAIDIIGDSIIVSAPGDDATLTDAGSVYIFKNENMTRGWNLIRYQDDRVDINSVNRMYLYDSRSNIILNNLEFIDPAKGKILGQADQEITYKTEYDPAVYNKGAKANTSYYWNQNQVGKVWWNLSLVRFVNYEQGSSTYRTINWGKLFPNSVIEVCEWVESDVLPSQYVDAGYDGVPKYDGNTNYVEIPRVDPVTNIIANKYYFWVKDKTSVDPTDPTRKLPIKTVADYIENPKSQGISYAAIISDDAIALYNVAQYLSGQDTKLHIDYENQKNDNLIHSEYELIQEGNATDQIPQRILDKFIDSLSGIDKIGQLVPDPTLSVADRYGIARRPRQSMFVDRLRAMKDLVTYVNNILIKKPIAKQYDLTQLNSEEEKPNFKLGEYDLAVDTEENLLYIETVSLSAGYKVLVNQNTEQSNLWTLHELQEDKTWNLVKVQSFKTSLFWEYVDWYADGYSPEEVIEYSVETLPDALKLSASPGDEILVKVTSAEGGVWNLLTVTDTGEYQVVGIQNGTIKLSNSLGNFADNNIGLGNQGYDTNRFDQSPNIEIRYILNALKDDIFINELQGEFNNLFFVMMNYMFTEQNYVDWIFRTSFVSVSHFLRELNQPANYIKDNLTYYENYINEVKPYRTKIREYLTSYSSNDTFEGSVTDFDLAPYYDPDTKVFRSPSGEIVNKDTQLWATGYLTTNNQLINSDYTNWYNHRNFHIEEVIIVEAGSGYSTPPAITFQGGGATVQATATATIDGDTGAITAINIVTPGKGYYETPTIIINGSATVEAKAYATINNNQLRLFDTTIKFDRINYTSDVVEWTENTTFTANTIVSYNGIGYKVLSNITTNDTFVTSDYEIYSSSNFTNANDRIMAYYNPTNTMPAKDLNQLIYGIEYPGVQIQGLDFTQQPGFDGILWANVTFDSDITVSVGDVISQPESDIMLTFNTPITANIGQFVTQTSSGANATIYGNTIASGQQGNVSGVVAYLTKNNDFEFDNIGIIDIDGVNQSSYVFDTDTETWANVEIKPLEVTIGNHVEVEYPVTDPTITVTRVYSNTKIQGTYTTTADFITSNTSIRNGNILINNVWQSTYPTTVDFISTTAKPFDSLGFDTVEYTEDGIPLVSQNALDTVIRSTYTDSSLGTRAEDINVDGGEYVDTYSSHAPEELVPGITFDTLDLKVYTKINGNVDVLGYRIFNNMVRDNTYLRISDYYTTPLVQDLLITDTQIYVQDVTLLDVPNLDENSPGVIFIGSERITYWTVDTATNSVGQIRRGTQGTAAQNIHQVGELVHNAGPSQVVPNTVHTTDTLTSNLTVNVGNVYTKTITVGTELEETEVWYNAGANVATDGTGFEGATTAQVNFLKLYPATETSVIESLPNELVTEAVNSVITTEDDDPIIRE